MRKLSKPTLEPKAVYKECISRIRNNGLRDRLDQISKDIELAATNYDDKGKVQEYYQFVEPASISGVVNSKELEDVYTIRMAKKKAPGRRYYEIIRSSSPLDICSFCGHRIVSTIDHYLPKAQFPSVAVLPLNLIPSCADCNKEKNDDIPTSEINQLLHPYYDDVSQEQWLFAEVLEGTPVGIRFYVGEDINFTATIKTRLKKHFKDLKLGALYSSQAGTELSNIRLQLNNLLVKSGTDQVKEHLLESYISRKSNHINSWQTAMYQVLANNEWFYSGGFNSL